MYGRAWDSFQSVWLIKHRRSEQNVELFYSRCRLQGLGETNFTKLLSLVWSWSRFLPCCKHIHIWGPYFYIITIFPLHISSWRLFGLNLCCVCAVAITWLLLHRASPFFLLSSSPPAALNFLHPALVIWLHLSILKPGWPVWREVLAQLMQAEKEPLLPS